MPLEVLADNQNPEDTVQSAVTSEIPGDESLDSGFKESPKEENGEIAEPDSETEPPSEEAGEHEDATENDAENDDAADDTFEDDSFADESEEDMDNEKL